jgi:NAD-dependent dihydropyrimidine dehydrogenase PreA subunit
MRIIIDKCNGCGLCVMLCPVQAIKLINYKAIMNNDQCVECYVCYHDAKCPTKAIKPERLKWPRVIRSPFSSVISFHKLTGIPGRGTEEMKTNDVTNRFNHGEIGVSIELGRPGVSTSLNNIELFTKKLLSVGVQYEELSPVTSILNEDQATIKEELINERVLSCIIEFKVEEEKLPQVLEIIKTVENEIDTVFSVGIVTRVMENNAIPIINTLNEHGFSANPNAKINIGLGR